MEGKALPLNPSFEALLLKPLPCSLDVSISLSECSSLEALFSGQVEGLSHAMWVLTGLLGLIRQEGFVPKDQQLFNQFVSSLSMSLAHQSNVAAADANFTCLKHRCLLVRHLEPIYPENLKQDLLASSSSFASSLFDESKLSRFIALSG